MNPLPKFDYLQKLTVKQLSNSQNEFSKIKVVINDVESNSKDFTNEVFVDTLELNMGKNLISVIGIDKKQKEVLLKSIEVVSTEKQYTPQVHFIGVGVNLYQYLSPNLNYCIHDVEDVSNALTKRYGKKKYP